MRNSKAVKQTVTLRMFDFRGATLDMHYVEAQCRTKRDGRVALERVGRPQKRRVTMPYKGMLGGIEVTVPVLLKAGVSVRAFLQIPPYYTSKVLGPGDEIIYSIPKVLVYFS